MGCCLSVLSRDATPSSSYASGILTDGRRADIASPSGIHTTAGAIVSAHHTPSLPSATTATTTEHTAQSTSPRRPPLTHLPLSDHYNLPIRPHVWYSKRRTWTRAQLDRERREFFETRITGRPEVWAALSSVISLIWTCDLETAQGIIDAAGVTVPTGDLCQGCYDEQGVLYRLPQCIVSDPENMVDGDPADEDLDDATSDGKMGSDDASGDELISSSELEQRREEKGKTSERDLITVKARLSDRGGPDMILSVGQSQSVGFIARKVQHDAGIPNSYRVRIAYLGKILKEQLPLPDQGWKAGNVVNALIVKRNPLPA